MTRTRDRRPAPVPPAVGDSGPTVTLTDISRGDIVRWAGASGDFNPSHFDEAYARAGGHEGIFAQGMLVAGHMERLVTRWFGLDRIQRLSFRFEAKTFPGDSIEITGTVTDRVEQSGGVHLTADLTASNQDGETVVSGAVTVRYPGR